MKRVLGITAAIVGVLGVITEESWIVAAALIVALRFSWIAYRDLHLITHYLLQPRLGSPRITRGESLLKLQSELGNRAFQAIRSLERKVADLSWEMNQSQKSDSLLADLRGDEATYLRRLFSMIAAQFRSRAAALLLYRAGELSIHVHGQQGPRFEHALRLVFARYLERGDRVEFGIQFGARDDNPLGLFGIGSSLAYPVNVPDGRGVIWLGYDRGSVPSLSESKALASLAEGLHRDIIARRRIEEMTTEMRRVESEAKAQNELIAGMSHDIRAPLHNIKNILMLFKLENSSDENMTLLTSALHNCDEVTDMTEDLLLLSRYQLGRLTARAQQVDIRAEVHRLIESYRASAQLKGLSLSCRVDIEGAVGIQVDQRHLRRMLGNLVSNAIKYSYSGGVSVIVQTLTSERVLISISDTGIGLSSEQLQQLFVPFTRFNSGATEGVGLGLAITKILAELNGGEVRAQSSEGIGSEFQISFPTINLAESACAGEFSKSSDRTIDRVWQSVAPLLDGQGGDPCFDSKLSILLVDDDSDGRTSLARMLAHSGVKVFQASGVNEALGFIRLERPNLVVSDCSMPDGGGERILREIESCAPGIPVMIVSGSDDAPKLQSLLALGAVACLTKPVSAAVLQAQIKSALMSRSSVIAA